MWMYNRNNLQEPNPLHSHLQLWLSTNWEWGISNHSQMCLKCKFDMKFKSYKKPSYLYKEIEIVGDISGHYLLLHIRSIRQLANPLHNQHQPQWLHTSLDIEWLSHNWMFLKSNGEFHKYFNSLSYKKISITMPRITTHYSSFRQKQLNIF